MQYYRKTRQGVFSNAIGILIKFSAFIAVLAVIVFIIGSLDLSAPNKFIKQKIPNEKFKVIK